MRDVISCDNSKCTRLEGVGDCGAILELLLMVIIKQTSEFYIAYCKKDEPLITNLPAATDFLIPATLLSPLHHRC